jgi:hypothetical protein
LAPPFPFLLTLPARLACSPHSFHLPPPRPRPARYVPDYTKCLDHFALHAGGYAVLKGIQKGMNLPMEMMLPSFASLRDYGNTSSSTTWYSMAYLERFGLVKKGQRIMQVRFVQGARGAGFSASQVAPRSPDVQAWRPCWRGWVAASAGSRRQNRSGGTAAAGAPCRNPV